MALVEPMILPAKQRRAPSEVNVREVLNAVFYVLSTGCQWQALLKDRYPRARHCYFMLWDWDGTLERLHHTLYVATREQEGREASPTAAIIDSQSAKPPAWGSTLDPQGFDAGKKVTGRKRHILVDTLGLLLNVVVHPADVQGIAMAPGYLDRRTRRLFPFVERIFADAGYQGAKAAAAVAKTGSWKLEIVKRTSGIASVRLQSAGLSSASPCMDCNNRRLARDFERYARSAAAFVRLAMIRIMLKRLTTAHCS